MRKILLSAAAILAMLPAAAARQDRDIPAATPAGDPVDCVSVTQIRSTKVRSDQVIDFEMTGGRVYRNTLPYDCPSLGFERRFGYRISGTQLCSVDTIRVLQSPGITPGASCGLGSFQPVTLADAR